MPTPITNKRKARVLASDKHLTGLMDATRQQCVDAGLEDVKPLEVLKTQLSEAQEVFIRHTKNVRDKGTLRMMADHNKTLKEVNSVLNDLLLSAAANNEKQVVDKPMQKKRKTSISTNASVLKPLGGDGLQVPHPTSPTESTATSVKPTAGDHTPQTTEEPKSKSDKKTRQKPIWAMSKQEMLSMSKDNSS